MLFQQVALKCPCPDELFRSFLRSEKGHNRKQGVRVGCTAESHAKNIFSIGPKSFCVTNSDNRFEGFCVRVVLCESHTASLPFHQHFKLSPALITFPLKQVQLNSRHSSFFSTPHCTRKYFLFWSEVSWNEILQHRCAGGKNISTHMKAANEMKRFDQETTILVHTNNRETTCADPFQFFGSNVSWYKLMSPVKKLDKTARIWQIAVLIVWPWDQTGERKKHGISDARKTGTVICLQLVRKHWQHFLDTGIWLFSILLD